MGELSYLYILIVMSLRGFLDEVAISVMFPSRQQLPRCIIRSICIDVSLYTALVKNSTRQVDSIYIWGLRDQILCF